MDQLPDSSLIELAKGGDQSAFAELYSRYFDPVYDFVARMTRNRDEAADIAQDTFLKAMNALGGLQKGASFKSWIFTIARNTALNRIEKSSRTRPLTFAGEDGEEVSFDVVDADRFSDPEEAAEASAFAALVWEAAAGLDPKQLTLLDLHLRQGLDSAEIADVLGVTKNNGYVMLNRLKKAVEDSIGAFIMLKSGRQYCEDLDFVLSRADIQGMSPEARKVVERHVAECPNCEERKRKLAPLAAFAAFGAIGAPAGAKAHILDGLLQQWPGPATTGGGAGGAGGEAAAAGAGGNGIFGKSKLLVPALGGLAALLFGALFLPQSPLALFEDGDGGSAEADSSEPLPPDGTPTPNPGSGSGGATATATTTPTPGGTVSATAQPGQVNPSATPTRTSTPVPTPGPGTPTFTPSPTATRTNTPTVTPTPGPNTPTATPTSCVPMLRPNVEALTIAPGGNSSFQVFNESTCSTVFSVSPQTGWLSTGSGGTINGFETKGVAVSVNGSLPAAPGTYTGDVVVAWSGGSFSVTVTATREGPTATPTSLPNTAPVVNSASGTCTPPNTTFSVSASDDSGVTNVTVSWTDSGGNARQFSLSSSGGNTWSGTTSLSTRAGSGFVAVAGDGSLTGQLGFGAPC